MEDPKPEVYLSDNYIVLDFETTNFEHGSPYEARNSLVTAHWTVGPDHPSAAQGGRNRSCRGSEFEQSRLLHDIRQADFVVAHFTKFELGWLARCGLDLRTVLPYCTQIGEYVIAGNRDLPGGLGLEATAGRYGVGHKKGFVHQCIEAGICPSELPPGDLADYCEQDVSLTETIFLRQREKLRELGLLAVTWARNVVTPPLVDIESRGMCLDETRVRSTHADYIARYGALLKQFETLTGGINPRSGKQMREYLYETLGFEEATDHKGLPLRTSGGKKGAPQPRTDKQVLPMLKASTPEQKEFKRLAMELAKLKVPVQNLTKMVKILDKGERIVYASINQTITDTHRFSSSGRKGGFQFHNFDRAFKPLFTARPGSQEGSSLRGRTGSSGRLGGSGERVIVEGDAPQLEFRVAGHLGADPVARRAALTGEDVHAFTASILGVSRQAAKPHTFKPLYGGQSGTNKEKAYYKAFREKYKDIYKTQKGWTLDVARDKQLRIASGLIFYWPNTRISADGYVSGTPSIFNYPIQSFATADIIPLTLALVWHELVDVPGAFLVNTVHDSIIGEVGSENLAKYVDVLVRSFTETIYDMLERLYGIRFSMPLGVAIKAGSHWAEGEERKYEPRRKFE